MHAAHAAVTGYIAAGTRTTPEGARPPLALHPAIIVSAHQNEAADRHFVDRIRGINEIPMAGGDTAVCLRGSSSSCVGLVGGVVIVRR